MQYLLPVGVCGASSNKCPKCPLHFLQTTSIRFIPNLLSFLNSTLEEFASKKLGHPVPESNLASEEKSSAPQPAQIYLPFSLFLRNLPVKGFSVAFSLKTLYSSGFSFSFHPSSSLGISLKFILKIIN